MAIASSLRLPATLTVPLAIPLALITASTIVGFPATLGALGDALERTTVHGFVTLVPLMLCVTIVMSLIAHGPAEKPKLEPALLGAAVPLLAALLLTWFGPARLGYTYWFLRADVFALACLILGGAMVAVGTRAVMRSRTVIIMFIACLPVLTLPLATVIEKQLTQWTRVLVERFVEIANINVVGGGSTWRLPNDTLLEIAPVCAGVEGLAVAALLAGPIAVATTGPRIRRAGLVLGVALALIVGNAVRITVLLAVGGPDTDSGHAVHEWGGLALAVAVVTTTWLLLPRLGVHWNLTHLHARITYTRKHLVLGTSAIATVAIACAVSQAYYGFPGLLHATGSGGALPRAWEQAGGGATRIALTAPGYTLRRDTEMDWFADYFGAESIAESFTLLEAGDSAAPPVWAQVIVASDRRTLEQFGPVNCFIAHGAHIYSVRQVALPGGAATLIDQRQERTRFTALSWTQPVALDDGREGYRRVVLFAEAERGDDTSERTQLAPDALSGSAIAVVNLFSPYRTDRPKGWDYGAAQRRLIRAATSIITPPEE